MNLKEKRYLPALKNGRFQCYKHDVNQGFLWATASMLVRSAISRVNPFNRQQVSWYNPEPPVMRSQELVITWIGHSTILIQVNGLNILTDPIYGNASLLYPRIIKPGIAFKQLPPIDLVLLSHNHPDHMEASTITLLAKQHKAHFFVPRGDKQWFIRHSIAERVTEFMWWQKQVVNDRNNRISCTFLPAIHWTQRTPFDRNKSLWGSWMITTQNITIYFAGDTAYGEHFAVIAQEFPQIDVALLPIGPCEPREFMKHSHMNAQEAGQALIMLGARHCFPIHWGTFHFGNEPASLPLDRLKSWWLDQQNLTAKLCIPQAGKKHINFYV